MSKFLFLLVGVIVLSKTNGTPMSSKSSLPPDDRDDEFNIDDWNELDVIYPGDPYSEIPEKRISRDSLMRRSTLDKNFMRFGRSGFFPGERWCRQKDLVGLAENYASVRDPITLTKRETDSNFMRFGRGGIDNFMRFGKGGDNFMRFGRPEKDKGNFMRFGKSGDNFMRFGRPDKSKGNFMRFGRGKDDNFIRFGRGDDDAYILDETDDDEGDTFSRLGKSDNFMRFGKNPVNFIRYGKSGGKDDSFIRFGKSGRNATNFLRFGRELEEDSNGDDGTKPNPTTRRRRMTEGDTRERMARSPELMEAVLPETKRSAMEDAVTKPDLLRFISLLNKNHPNWDRNDVKIFFPSVPRNPVLKPDTETYKRKPDGNGFIRFG